MLKQAQQASVPASKIDQSREEVEDAMAKMEQIRVSQFCCCCFRCFVVSLLLSLLSSLLLLFYSWWCSHRSWKVVENKHNIVKVCIFLSTRATLQFKNMLKMCLRPGLHLGTWPGGAHNTPSNPLLCSTLLAWIKYVVLIGHDFHLFGHGRVVESPFFKNCLLFYSNKFIKYDQKIVCSSTFQLPPEVFVRRMKTIIFSSWHSK